MHAPSIAPTPCASQRKAIAWLLGLLAVMACFLVLLASPALAGDCGDPLDTDNTACVASEPPPATCVVVDLDDDPAEREWALLPRLPALAAAPAPQPAEPVRHWTWLKTPPPQRPPRQRA